MNARRFRLGMLTLLAAGAGIAVVVTLLSVLVRPEARLRWDLSSGGQALLRAANERAEDSHRPLGRAATPSGGARRPHGHSRSHRRRGHRL